MMPSSQLASSLTLVLTIYFKRVRLLKWFMTNMNRNYRILPYYDVLIACNSSLCV